VKIKKKEPSKQAVFRGFFPSFNTIERMERGISRRRGLEKRELERKNVLIFGRRKFRFFGSHFLRGLNSQNWFLAGSNFGSQKQQPERVVIGPFFSLYWKAHENKKGST
jgi:hypothetical protein